MQLPLASRSYLIDCSAIMDFSGADYANATKYSLLRDTIWNLIERLIEEGRLKTVSQVMRSTGELHYHDEASYNRLHPFGNQFVLPSNADIDAQVGATLKKYPRLIDPKQTYTREPADPYLIVYAQALNLTIITSEVPLERRRGKRKTRKESIPDVCRSEDIPCMSLDDFLYAEMPRG